MNMERLRGEKRRAVPKNAPKSEPLLQNKGVVPKIGRKSERLGREADMIRGVFQE